MKKIIYRIINSLGKNYLKKNDSNNIEQMKKNTFFKKVRDPSETVIDIDNMTTSSQDKYIYYPSQKRSQINDIDKKQYNYFGQNYLSDLDNTVIPPLSKERVTTPIITRPTTLVNTTPIMTGPTMTVNKQIVKVIKEEENKVDENRVEKSRLDESRVDESRVDESRLDESRVDESRVDESRVDENRVDESRVDENRVDESRVEESRVEESRVEESRVEESRVEESRVEESRMDENIVEEIMNNISENIVKHKEKKSEQKVEDTMPKKVVEETKKEQTKSFDEQRHSEERSDDSNDYTEENLLFNLKIISELNASDKLSYDSKMFSINNPTYTQGIYRWWCGEDRAKTLSKLNEIVDATFNYMDKTFTNQVSLPGSSHKQERVLYENNSQVMQKFYLALVSSIKGLDNLKSTYSYDKSMTTGLNLLMDRIRRRTDKIDEILKITPQVQL